MLKETEQWLLYAKENLDAAKILFESGLYNPCLHNIQQSIEKSLKALLCEKIALIKKTHSIMELKSIITSKGVYLSISDDECDFIDSIYLPTKYPLGSTLPYFYPDKDLCNKAVGLASSVFDKVSILL